MKHLFICESGFSHCIDHPLVREGEKQVKALGRSIREVLNGMSVYIITSTAMTSIDSSNVLTRQFKLKSYHSFSDLERIPFLWKDADPYNCTSPREYEKINEALLRMVNERREKADGLVIMSHGRVGQYFPKYFLEKEFGTIDTEYKLPHSLQDGQAVHFDLKQKTFQILP